MKYLIGDSIINTDYIVRIENTVLRYAYANKFYNCVTITLSCCDSLQFSEDHENYHKALELYNLMLAECKNQ
jgi:hypothetical protein